MDSADLRPRISLDVGAATSQLKQVYRTKGRALIGATVGRSLPVRVWLTIGSAGKRVCSGS